MRTLVVSLLAVVVFFSFVPAMAQESPTGWTLEELMTIANFNGKCDWEVGLQPNFYREGFWGFFPSKFEGVICTESGGNTWHYGYSIEKYQEVAFDNMAAVTVGLSLSSLKFLGSTDSVVGAEVIAFQQDELFVIANTVIAIRVSPNTGQVVGLSYCQVPWGNEFNLGRSTLEYVELVEENQIQWKFTVSEVAYGCTLQ